MDEPIQFTKFGNLELERQVRCSFLLFVKPTCKLSDVIIQPVVATEIQKLKNKLCGGQNL